MDAPDVTEEMSMAARRKSKTAEESPSLAQEPGGEGSDVSADAGEAAQIGFDSFGERTEVRSSAASSNSEPSQGDEPGAPAEPSVEPEAAAPGQAAEAGDVASEEASPPNTRKRIEEQLEALKRREAELRRELAIADHPELTEPLRVLEGHAYAVARVEAKMAQGLSKAEERRRETLEKKLASAREKRAEIDTQIAELEAELAPLGEARMLAFEAERKDCMERLLAALGTHEGDFQRAGLDTSILVPDLARLMPEVRTLAENLAKSARVQS
jgi:hypothetical protein